MLGRQPVPLGQDETVAEGVTQCGDMGLERFDGGAWRTATPEQFHEHVGRHDRSAVQPEQREDGARFGAWDCDRQAILPDLREVPKPPAPPVEAYFTQQSSG